MDLLRSLDRHVSSGLLSPDPATLSELMGDYQVPGVSIAVGHRDGELSASGHGVTDRQSSSPVTEQTPFAACSVSKHVAAFGAMRLVQQGVLALDADISATLTSWRLLDRAGQQPAVTLRQLLAHTAGLTGTWYRGYRPDAVPTLLQVLEGSAPATTPPVRSALLPGSRFRYSGSHYSVLQQLMIDATGTSFATLVQELVLTPLGMTGSGFSPPPSAARGHHGVGTPVPGGWRAQPELAAAGLWSTPTDLVRLDLEIARASAGSSTLLDRSLATEMLTPQLPGGSHGLGTELDPLSGRFGHTGQNVGYTCFSYVWPGSGVAVAAMTNSEDGWELLSALRAAADRRYAPAVPSPAVPGRYFLRPDYPIDITAAADGLTFSAGGQQPVTLLPRPDGRYDHPGLDLQLRFRPTGDGSPELELRQEGTSQTATVRPSPRA